MSDDREFRLYELWLDAAQKFDYFMIGLPAAVVGFLAQDLSVDKIGFTPNTLQIAALLVLLASIFAGFKRVEVTVHLVRLGSGKEQQRNAAEYLEGVLTHGGPILSATSGELIDPSRIATALAGKQANVAWAAEQEKKHGGHAEGWYVARNALLLLGFLLLVASKVWSAYV